jgi:hypothetical protein
VDWPYNEVGKTPRGPLGNLGAPTIIFFFLDQLNLWIFFGGALEKKAHQYLGSQSTPGWGYRMLPMESIWKFRRSGDVEGGMLYMETPLGDGGQIEKKFLLFFALQLWKVCVFIQIFYMKFHSLPVCMDPHRNRSVLWIPYRKIFVG